MCQQITSKVTVILLVLGVMSNTFKSQASPIRETANVSTKSSQANKHNFLSSASIDAEDIVVDEPILFNFSSNTTCNVSSVLKKRAGESMDIVVGNNPIWRATFKAGGQSADIALSYDYQTDHLVFNKSLSSNVTYTVDPNGTFMNFYLNGNPFFSIVDMKTCDKSMCATINFSLSTVLTRYECSPSGNSGSNALTAKTGPSTQHTNANQQVSQTDNAVHAKEGLNKTIFATLAASPNPFTNNVTIRYNLVTDAHVNVTVYNGIGQVVDVLVNQHQTKGVNAIDWQAASNMKSGLYFYEITANNERMVGKLIKQ
jgi:Secretion system C-terminal sorting domain